MDFIAELSFGKTYELNKHSTPAGDWIVEGYASTSDLDSQNHIVSPEAIKMGADSLIKYNTVLFNHDPDRPIGKVKTAEAQDSKLWMKVAVSKTEPKLWEQIKDGTLSKFSIRGSITDSEYYSDERTFKDILVIKGMELHEVSLVSVPANPEAKSLGWYIEKSIKEQKEKDDLEKKTYRKPNESLADCISRKTKANIAEGMKPKQAVAAAYSMCGDAKKDINLEELYDLVFEMLKEEKNQETQKSDETAGGDKGGLPMEDTKKDESTTEVKKEVTTEKVETKTEEVKKEVEKPTEEVKKEATIDVAALTSVITQLQGMVKDANAAVEAVNKNASDIAKAKEDVQKLLNEFNEAVKNIPIRKGAPAEKEEDRTKETVVVKKVTETEEFQKMNPGDQLRSLILEHAK